MIQNLLVLGSGSAGLLAALSFKRKLPQINVRIVRSPEIGTIGVGEGTTTIFPEHLFDYLGLSRRRFYATAQPTWKLGLHFLWGPRDHFDFSFSHQLDGQWSDLPRHNGFYCEDDFSYADLTASLMAEQRVFARQPGQAGPDITPNHGFHIENARLIETLENVAKAWKIEFVDGKVSGAERGPQGVTAVHLEDGRRLDADFFIDASGFRSELLGKTLEEPFLPYKNALFCDRAVVGGWERAPDEPILPYTTVETMTAGWAWQIEHEHHVNRGYVFSSAHLDDDDAREEFLLKNPRANKDGRVVKFRSGRYQRLWVDNVAAVGNAAGFVEPLEATALMMVCIQCRMLIDLLTHSVGKPGPSIRGIYNRFMAEAWDEIRDFLGIHYKFNTRLDTPFWQHCQQETDVSNLDAVLEFYRENGPNADLRQVLPNRTSNYGSEGFMVLLLGNRVPHAGRYEPTATERQTWERHRQENRLRARAGMTVKEALDLVRSSKWRWHGDPS